MSDTTQTGTGVTGARPLVRIERHGEGGHVAELVLDRPEAMNAVSTDMARAIAAVTGEVADDETVRAVVVSSSHDRAFCVGADLKERNRFTDDELRAQRPLARAAYRGVLDLPVPVVAAVDGFALGGGFEIALSCDLIVAGEGATVGLPEVSVGVIPGGGGTQLLTRRVGWSRAASMVFTARRLTAAEAHQLGVVDEVVAAGTARDRALELASTIASHSPVGVRNAKRAMRLGFDTDLGSGLDVEDECWRATAFSGDRAEGVAAFAEKRRPVWPGR
ncbi:Enoyl-CoA hydratase/carnithine racemase [Pedococcus cremeus]|uniref:enoyl-CoA hydratase n=1 Tax=Pedococcus cremeus TaxID=587636 RepID=A0A1H9X9S5_9MICO|nr:enoyl-CoA hydratase-related protein [Pedococcus cremeus]SES42809.1 Enoyl-CoA hydratase/carnithine racemase [Pedococcus cremeus]